MLALDEKMASEAAHALAKVIPTGGQAEKPNSNGPVCGAAAGRAVIVTAITTIMIAVTMEPKPSHVTQPSWCILRTDPSVAVITKATNPNVMEQVACLETALKAIEKPRMESPAQMLNLSARRTTSKGGRNAHPSHDVNEFRGFSSDEGPSLVTSTELFRNDAKVVRHMHKFGTMPYPTMRRRPPCGQKGASF